MPAASGVSNMDDFARFVAMMAAGGVTPDGRRVLRAESVAEIERNQVAGLDTSADFAVQITTFGTYGLGVWRDRSAPDGTTQMISGSGSVGFYPWIDRERGAYGILLVDDEGGGNGHAVRASTAIVHDLVLPAIDNTPHATAGTGVVPARLPRARGHGAALVVSLTMPQDSGPSDRSLAGYCRASGRVRTAGPATAAPGMPMPGLALQPGERLVAPRFAIASTMAVWRAPGNSTCRAPLPTGGAVGGGRHHRMGRAHRPRVARAARPLPRPAGRPAGRAAWPHANGSLYITQGRWCHRLAPDCSVLAARELPRDAAYNSLVVLPDGHLVMKDFAGGTGLHRLADGRRGSELVVLEPEQLEVVARHELPEGSIARLSMAADTDTPDGSVYVIGDRHAMRLRWDPTAARFVPDDAWFVDYHRVEGQTFGWDVVVDGDSAWFLDNGEGSTNFGPSFRGKGVDSTSPLHLIRVPPPRPPTAPPRTGAARCVPRTGWAHRQPAGDRRRAAHRGGYDSAQRAAPWRFGPPALPAEPLWSGQDHAGHLIRYPDTGELVTGDFDHEANTDQVVVLDIETGAEKGRSRPPAPSKRVSSRRSAPPATCMPSRWPRSRGSRSRLTARGRTRSPVRSWW
jgi:hypothetical protein